MGRPQATRHALRFALVVAVTVTGCTQATDPVPGTGQTASPAASPAVSPELPSPSPTGPTDEEAVAAIWKQVHDSRLQQTYSDEDLDTSEFADVATDQVQATLTDLIDVGRSDVPVTLAGSELWPSVTISPDGQSADITDCILVQTDTDRGDAAVTPTAWSGTATATPDGWVLDGLTLGAGDCVPDELNRLLLDAYRAWHDGKNQWGDPPDPDHPLLPEVMVGPGLTDARDLAAEHAAMGIVVRDRHDLSNAVVFELGIGRARVSDCFPAQPHNITAYDAETGERREDLSPTPTAGQVDRTVADLERTSEGTWKVSGWRSTTNNDCTPGSTPYVVVD